MGEDKTKMANRMINDLMVMARPAEDLPIDWDTSNTHVPAILSDGKFETSVTLESAQLTADDQGTFRLDLTVGCRYTVKDVEHEGCEIELVSDGDLLHVVSVKASGTHAPSHPLFPMVDAAMQAITMTEFGVGRPSPTTMRNREVAWPLLRAMLAIASSINN